MAGENQENPSGNVTERPVEQQSPLGSGVSGQAAETSQQHKSFLARLKDLIGVKKIATGEARTSLSPFSTTPPSQEQSPKNPRPTSEPSKP